MSVFEDIKTGLEQAIEYEVNNMETRIVERTDEQMATDEVAALLVRLYADYKCGSGNWDDDLSKKYADAVGIAIRMLSD